MDIIKFVEFGNVISEQDTYDAGPLVKRLRHRPFTAVTRVRVP